MVPWLAPTIIYLLLLLLSIYILHHLTYVLFTISTRFHQNIAIIGYLYRLNNSELFDNNVIKCHDKPYTVYILQ